MSSEQTRSKGEDRTLKCLNCGHSFENPKEYHGEPLEHFGYPCHETFYGCPLCLGDYDEIEANDEDEPL
jgi:hypothetical protein